MDAEAKSVLIMRGETRLDPSVVLLAPKLMLEADRSSLYEERGILYGYLSP
jgi:hypothetical protein